jgi:hypothetical protein
MKTRRQKKHEMLITFMANVKREDKKKQAPATLKPLRALFSFFL